MRQIHMTTRVWQPGLVHSSRKALEWPRGTGESKLVSTTKHVAASTSDQELTDDFWKWPQYRVGNP